MGFTVINEVKNDYTGDVLAEAYVNLGQTMYRVMRSGDKYVTLAKFAVYVNKAARDAGRLPIQEYCMDIVYDEFPADGVGIAALYSKVKATYTTTADDI